MSEEEEPTEVVITDVAIPFLDLVWILIQFYAASCVSVLVVGLSVGIVLSASGVVALLMLRALGLIKLPGF